MNPATRMCRGVVRMSAPGAVRAREPLLDRATRRRRRRVRVVEGLVFLLGYILYEVLHDLVPRQVATADSHGLALLHAEQHLGVACEQLLNQWLAARPTLAAFTIFWYSDAHFAVTVGLLLLTAKISGGRRWRLAWYVTTAIALLVFWLDPTAPRGCCRTRASPMWSHCCRRSERSATRPSCGCPIRSRRCRPCMSPGRPGVPR